MFRCCRLPLNCMERLNFMVWLFPKVPFSQSKDASITNRGDSVGTGRSIASVQEEIMALNPTKLTILILFSILSIFFKYIMIFKI